MIIAKTFYFCMWNYTKVHVYVACLFSIAAPCTVKGAYVSNPCITMMDEYEGNSLKSQRKIRKLGNVVWISKDGGTVSKSSRRTPTCVPVNTQESVRVCVYPRVCGALYYSLESHHMQIFSRILYKHIIICGFGR